MKSEKKKTDLQYTLKFFRDHFEEEPEAVRVVGQIRLKGNEEQWYPDHEHQTIIGTLPSTLTNIPYDTCLMSIQAKTIFDNDIEFTQDHTRVKNTYPYNVPLFEDSIDGIMARLEIRDQKIDHWYRLYYELTTNNYERDVEVEILEWVISSEYGGYGEVYYRKTIPFLPWETPSFPEENE